MQGTAWWDLKQVEEEALLVRPDGGLYRGSWEFSLLCLKRALLLKIASLVVMNRGENPRHLGVPRLLMTN